MSMFRDAWIWWRNVTLSAYNSPNVTRKEKGKKFSSLKKKAPKYPGHTCPFIDDVLHILNQDPDFKNKQYRRVSSRLEKLRTQNDRLRRSGKYWYGISKALLKNQ